jgi:hypothetical protein
LVLVVVVGSSLFVHPGAEFDVDGNRDEEDRRGYRLSQLEASERVGVAGRPLGGLDWASHRATPRSPEMDKLLHGKLRSVRVRNPQL